ncbi:hypothetical protein VDIAB_120087 [Vibrio diabolicus]|nr:hypothetical protein VDIAB_120087 [Vibrio diabolicus]
MFELTVLNPKIQWSLPWLIWLANLDFVSFEALPCQRGGIIEIAITLASPFSRFF